MTVKNNPYLDEAIGKFLDAYSKRAELEGDFNSSKLEEYTAVNDEVSSLAGELIKYGIDVYQEDDDLSFLINDKEYTVTLDDMCRILSDEDFKTMISNLRKKEARQHNDQTDTVPVEDVQSYDDIMPHLFAGGEDRMSTQSLADYSLIDDLVNIQRKVMRYEHDKSVRKLTDEVERCREQITQKEHLLELKNSEIESLVKEKEDIEQKLADAIGINEEISCQLKDAELRTENAEALAKDREKEVAMANERVERSSQTIDKLNEENKKYLDSINDIKSSLASKESELSVLTASIKRAEDEKADISKEVDKLKGKLADVEKELEDTKQKVKDATGKSDAELERTKTELSTAKNELSVTKNELSTAKNELSSAKSELGNVKNELAASKNKVKNLEKSVSDKDAQIKKLKEGPIVTDEETAKKLDELTADNERLRHEVERLQSQPSKEQARKTDAVYEEKIAMLQKLAYTDEKCDVKNNNAFNVEYPAKEKDKITVSMVGICNMKIFNNTFGRAKGDIVIIKVAQMLKEAFPTSDIYRIMGDQFTIISEDMDIINVKNKLQEIEDTLEAEMINIVFGCVDGVTCKDHETALKQAESAMKQMKNRSGKASITRKNLAEIERAKESQRLKSEAAEDVSDKEDSEEPAGEEMSDETEDEIDASSEDIGDKDEPESDDEDEEEVDYEALDLSDDEEDVELEDAPRVEEKKEKKKLSLMPKKSEKPSKSKPSKNETPVDDEEIIISEVEDDDEELDYEDLMDDDDEDEQ